MRLYIDVEWPDELPDALRSLSAEFHRAATRLFERDGEFGAGSVFWGTVGSRLDDMADDFELKADDLSGRIGTAMTL